MYLSCGVTGDKCAFLEKVVYFAQGMSEKGLPHLSAVHEAKD